MAKATVTIAMVLLIGVAASSGLIARQAEAAVLNCDEVARAPEKFSGKPVVFFGSVTGFKMGYVLGEQDAWETWACKTKDGQLVAGGGFSVQTSESTRTQAADKANSRSDRFRVSGVVKAMPAGLPLFLEKAKIELASE